MSALDLIRPPTEGPQPTAFAVLRDAARADWQTAQPTTEEERKWYTLGFETKDDYEITSPVSPLPPAAYRFWWAVGLVDAKANRPRRATWRKQDAPDPSEKDPLQWGLLVGGGVAASLGLLLLVASSGSRTP